MIFQNTFKLSTSGHRDMHDITEDVNKILQKSNLKKGIVNIFNIGSTGVIGTIEFEPGLKRDLPEMLDKLLPPSRNYGHEEMWHDGNGHSHLQASTLGPSINIPFTEGNFQLGTWQQIFHLECDIKPRNRKIIVTVNGE